MKTILIFPLNVLSHYLRCLVLADQYDKEEYHILFLHSSKYEKYVKESGYGQFFCDQFDPEYVMNCARNFDFSWLNRADLERIMAAQAAVIHQYQADMVIGDVTPTLKMAAELTAVKYISLVNGYMTKYYALPRKLSRNHRKYKFLNKLPASVSDEITIMAEKFVFRKVHRPFKYLRNKYSLQPVTDYLSEIEGDENMICDQENLFPQKALPKTYQIIGPLIYNSPHREGSWLLNIDQHKPVICVCMGSTGDWTRLQFLNDEYYARYTVITAGDTNKVLFAPHIISRDFVNLNQVLEKTNLLICHGGNGTIYTGIANRVFMLCLSSHFEQEWNISAIERKGYGKSADELNGQEWKAEIKKYAEGNLKQVSYI